MAKCRVIKATEGWNVGDHVEPTGADLKKLLDQGVVELLEGEKEEEDKRDHEEPKNPQKIQESPTHPMPGQRESNEPVATGQAVGSVTRVEDTPNTKVETFTSGQKKITGKPTN